MLDVEKLQAFGLETLNTVIGWATSPQFFAQLGVIIVTVAVTHVMAKQIISRLGFFEKKPDTGPFLAPRNTLFACKDLLFALLTVFFLTIAIEISFATVGAAWLVRLAQGAGVVFLLYTVINRFLTHFLVRALSLYVGIPMAILQVFGLLDETVGFLDGISLEIGNIRISVYFLIKAVVAAATLFWLGRISNNAGQNVIRRQKTLDVPTRELFAKLFEIILFIIVFVVLLQVLGLNLTALTVFGGALGVGLGFGLQQIASNFISGIIILLERSIGVGDYIEMEDGKTGMLKEINMRSSTLETFDGKEINVPNEKFITTQFVNWTRDDVRQRYEVEFSVTYDTDLHKVPPVVCAAVSTHARVLQEPEKPDCELRGFGERGVQFGVEFWVDGLDDGPNKFSSDVLFLVWDALHKEGISMPYVQCESHSLGRTQPLGRTVAKPVE